MKRRGFIRALAAVPAVPALVAQQPIPATGLPGAGRAAARGLQGRGGAGTEGPKISLADANEGAEGNPHFFNAAQFATLHKLASVLMPPVKGNIGAVECDAPEFVDFLIGASPADRQQLYRNGLDTLNATARRHFAKSFAELDTKQADTILKPLLTAVPWVYDLPKDPMKRFIYQAHQDLRTAT